MDNQLNVRPLSTVGAIFRRFIKRFIYAQLSFVNGVKIILGLEQPFIRFTVEKDPPSIYWIFRIKDLAVQNLAERLDLPAGFALSPIQCLDTDKPDYLLVLNTYRVSGVTNSVRAEWSVFVTDGEKNIPRYMIVDARSANTSMDPLDIITKATPVIHERNADRVITQIGEGGDEFRSTLHVSEDDPVVTVSTPWITANDYIYWTNGVRDHTFYNGGLSSAKQLNLQNKTNVVNINAFWGQFVDPEPIHVLMLENEIEFVISPWENIDKLPNR